MNFRLHSLSFCAAVFFVLFNKSTQSPFAPYNFEDPAPAGSIAGHSCVISRPLHDEENFSIEWSISPYTNLTTLAYNAAGKEQGNLGNRLGKLNMAGIAYQFIDNPDAPQSQQVPILGDAADYPNLMAAAQTLNTALKNINWAQETTGFFSVEGDYQRTGIRSELCYQFLQGVRAILKTGISSYRFIPSFIDPSSSTNSPYPDNASDPLVKNLMTSSSREAIFEEIGIDSAPIREIVLDQTILQIDLSYPMQLNDHENDPAVIITPRISIGSILPTQEPIKTNADQNKHPLFKIPQGSKSFGFTIEGALDFDFIETIGCSCVFGYTFFLEESLNDFRMPNNQTQNILYPFTQKVRKTSGPIWHCGLLAKSHDFIEGLDCYGDIVWVVHGTDKIELLDQANEAIFGKGLKTVAKNSEWEGVLFHLGIAYEISKNLKIGGSYGYLLSGRNVYKPITLMASISLYF